MEHRLTQDFIKLPKGVNMTDCQSVCACHVMDWKFASLLYSACWDIIDPGGATTNQYKLTSLVGLHKVLV